MTTLYTFPMILGGLGSAVLGWLMFILSVFLILLILVQRGKGGGLTGALGGPGGQSAFGSKAGDTFTVITAVSAIIWGLVCAIAMYSLGVPPLTADDADFKIDDTPAITTPADDLGDGAGMGGLSGLSGLLPDEPADESTADPDGGDASSEPSDTESGEGTPSKEIAPAEPSPAPNADATEEEGESTAEPAPDADSESGTSDSE